MDYLSKIASVRHNRFLGNTDPTDRDWGSYFVAKEIRSAEERSRTSTKLTLQQFLRLLCIPFQHLGLKHILTLYFDECFVSLLKNLILSPLK